MTETAKARWRQALPWLICGLVIAYGYDFLVTTTASDLELYECKNLAAAVLAKHMIPESKSSPGQPAIFCHLDVQLPFLVRYDKVYIYGVIDKNSQDSIAHTMQEFRSKYRSRKMLIQFFSDENWKSWSNTDTGTHGSERGQETPIRLVWIR